MEDYLKKKIWPEEVKLKISVSNKLSYSKRTSKHGMQGRKQSFHSNAQNAFSNGTRPFIAINRSTKEQFGPFYFRRQASECLNIPYSPNIGSCLSGNIPSYKNFIFRKIEICSE